MIYHRAQAVRRNAGFGVIPEPVRGASALFDGPTIPTPSPGAAIREI